ncbi:SAM-dependent methyltransferase [Cohnella luojiensis]|uniref:Methyltransferase domain-containing protein n=1 Tax=Cohnella luojiensis TaxID=652876 RepID=A0A4Y8LV03_9BACL|nr:SAM-dependent methyltransferase [Cohnella luojiensis]TFE24892.1 methyltransferase domain-containing protein [Cohnella luojiensis]
MITYVATANPGFAPYAMEELRRRIRGTKVSGLAPGETFSFTTGDFDPEQLLKDLRRDEPIFLRHMFPIEAEYDVMNNPDETAATLREYAETLNDRVKGKKIAIQVRKEQGSPFPFASAEGRDVIVPVIERLGGEPAARDADWILSVYASKKKLYLGCSLPRDNLSDWPGGAVRFRKDEELISRAAFKLLEAERAFKLPLDRFSNALDLGAAPGGWTSVLLERGLKVTAVDPAEMDPSLELHPRLRHIRSNAADVSFAPGSFDLLVCDMSWDPHHTARIVSELAPVLSAGGSGIITLKLMYRKPFQSINDLMEDYGHEFDIRKVKQLFHNREEVTMWVKRK